ncbi:MAG: hypothetical protein Q9164_001667 [Protoblastenia rupestris]
MSTTRQTIAVAGVGDLGKYICEELLASPHFDIIVLTRSVSHLTPQSSHTNPIKSLLNPAKPQDHHPWCSAHNISTHQTDYTASSLLEILDTTNTTTLISFINLATPAYISVHTSMLHACQQSISCKRLIPSEWAGDSESFPLKPDYYATTREPFRQLLRQQDEIEWTLFNMGWLADYFLPDGKSHMRSIPDKFPIDAERWEAVLRGTGEEMQCWTVGRDVGRAVVELCRAEKWEVLEKHANDDPISNKVELAQVEEMMVKSYLACPKEKTLRQRDKYFAGIKFRGLDELLKDASRMDFL